MDVAVKVLVTMLWGASFSFVSPSERPVGWRMDGTGNYASASPPTTWNKTKNIQWKVKLPGGSQGSPIVVGDRIFVVSDPAELLCLNATDGKILWQRSNAVAEVYGKDKAEQMTAEYKRLREEKGKLEKSLQSAKGNEEKEKEIREQIDTLNKSLTALPMPPEFVSSESTNS